jgi:CBS domain-containing protein
MLIRDLLLNKGNTVYTITTGTSTLEAVKILNEKHIGALVVTDSSGDVAGILSERDILRHFQDSFRGVPAESIMTGRENLVITHGEDDIEYAMSVMTKKRIRHLPVFNGEKLDGIVSIGDVVKAFTANLEFEARMLNEYIAGSAAFIPSS